MGGGCLTERSRPAGRTTEHTYAGHVWVVADQADQPLAVFEAAEDDATAVIDAAHLPPMEPSAPVVVGTISPDGRWLATIVKHNVVLLDKTTGREVALTKNGLAGDYYEDDFHWSPDSRRLVVKRTQAAQERKVYFVESSPADQLQPKLLSEDYLKPGDRIAHPVVHLFRVPEGTEIPVSDALCPNPWDLDEFHWSPDSRLFTFTYNQRGHQAMRVIGVDAETGAGAGAAGGGDEDVHRLQRETLPEVSRRERRVYLDVRSGRLEPPVSVRCKNG